MFTHVYNRHVLVELVDEEEEEKQESLIALPQDYKKRESPYLVVKGVLDKAEDCNTFVEVCDKVVIERRMLVEIEIKVKRTICFENYIYGRIEDKLTKQLLKEMILKEMNSLNPKHEPKYDRILGF